VTETRSKFLQWTGVLTGPVTWLFDLGLIYLLVRHSCTSRSTVAVFAITLVALALTASGALVARTNLERSRFMAIGGMMLSAFFFLVIAAQAIPVFVLNPCER
jgi:hypothetical protein